MYSIKQKRSRKKTFLLSFLLVLVIAIAGAGWYVRSSYNDALLPVSNSKSSTVITIKSGSSVHEVALLLVQKNLIRKSWAFEWYVRSHNVRDKLQAGSYAFMPSMSIEQMVQQIIDGKVATDLFTILPAQRLDQIQAAFLKAGYAMPTVEAAFNASLYVKSPALTDKPSAASLEGYLYPESFQKTADTTPQTIIKASLDEMARALTPDVRAGIAKQGLTVHQGVILASIIEKEVSSTADRAKVAQVFLKRIKVDMPLGSDVTAYYGAEVAGLVRSVFTDTPYNTRIYKGLPPGPISNVSSSSLMAVANPASTDFLYFVAGDDGTTYFTTTLADHEAATAAHCIKLCQE